MFWGFSEAVDLLKEYKNHMKNDDPEPEEINILLFGCGDPRHILKTLANSFGHSTKINFFIAEGCLELLARNLLLLSIALEPSDQLTLKSKTHLFMDIFGNSLLRASSYGYVCSKAKHFLRCITGLDFARSTMPSFVFDRLKYSERDGLENIFEFWRNRNGGQRFDISRLWEQRQRRELGQRYDTRKGVFDWDLNMRLKDYGGGQICSQEYMHWRETGIAFAFPEFDHNIPNRTLATGIRQNGTQFMHQGYMGDISVGPFASFGLTCDDAAMLQSNHGTNEFRATDVTERNIHQLMYEIQERQPYAFDKADVHKYGSAQLLLPAPMPSQRNDIDENELRQYDHALLATPNMTVTYLSLDDVLELAQRKEFKALFHVVFISHTYFKLIGKEMATVFAENAIVLFETKQVSVLRKDDISKFLKEIRDFAKMLKLNAITNFNINLPISIVRYTNFLK